MKKTIFSRMSTVLVIALCFFIASCQSTEQQMSDSGVHKASIKLEVNPTTGMTAEQDNITQRLLRDNKPGSIKHLYVISSFSGECIMYSTVKGKVTSGGKRLSPGTVDAASGRNVTGTWGNYVQLNDKTYLTNEVLDDGGAYGDSMPYLYWFDTKGQYQQIYPSGGMMIFISEVPLNVKSVSINLVNSEPNLKEPVKKE